MNKYNWIFGAVVGCIMSLGIMYLTVPKQAFVSNQQLFASFSGKKELEAKLIALQNRHTHIIDSMRLEILSSKTAEENDYKGKVQFIQQVEEQFLQEQEEKSAEYTEQIWKHINQYVEMYGEENGYDFIYGLQGTGSMMYASKGRNITDEVLEFINRKYEGN